MTVMNRLWALYRFSLQYPGDGGLAHFAQVYGARVVVMVIIFGTAFGVVTVLTVTLRAF